MDVDVNCSVLSICYVILHQEAEDPTCQVAPLFLLVGAQWTNGKATLRMWITLQIFGYNCIFTCLRVWGLSRAGAESAAAPQSPTVFIQGARHKCSGLLWLSCEGGGRAAAWWDSHHCNDLGATNFCSWRTPWRFPSQSKPSASIEASPAKRFQSWVKSRLNGGPQVSGNMSTSISEVEMSRNTNAAVILALWHVHNSVLSGLLDSRGHRVKTRWLTKRNSRF